LNIEIFMISKLKVFKAKINNTRGNNNSAVYKYKYNIFLENNIFLELYFSGKTFFLQNLMCSFEKNTAESDIKYSHYRKVL